MDKNQRFAAARRAMRVSQGRVARHAGVSQTLVSQFELGNVSLRPELITALEDALRRELSQAARDAERVAQTLGSKSTTI